MESQNKDFFTRAMFPARMGFKTFPIAPGTKVPIQGLPWKEKSTQTPAVIREWNKQNPHYSVGIDCAAWQGKSLVVIDIDKEQSAEELEVLGFEFPETLSQTTPRGGRHLFYTADKPVRNTVGHIAPGIDTRSEGGYVVLYDLKPAIIQECPEWVLEKLAEKKEKANGVSKTPLAVDPEDGIKRAEKFLKNADVAVEGAGGNATTFKAAARVKDFGVSREKCIELVEEFWNDRCIPPWEPFELRNIINNVYSYGTDPQGVDTPEAEFSEPISPPIPAKKDEEGSPAVPAEQIQVEDASEREVEKLNRCYAFTIVGGSHIILWETKDAKGKPCTEYLMEQTFHKQLAPVRFYIGDTSYQISKTWINHPKRREYKGLCFLPEQKTPRGWYNLWQGFAVKPAPGPHSAVSQLLEHLEKNVCGGDKELTNWLIAYFAHLIQRPGEKPLVALVFRGGKGVGKSVIADRIGHLLGAHYKKAANIRYLTGNFNTHFEQCLLFCLEEAFWSGDKKAEGVLKELITGPTHLIEPKGRNAYEADNLTRVIVISNEDWVVPASEDERRYAVFDVGEGRKQDREFFRSMREGMEKGGAAHLLDYLQHYDISGFDLNQAPHTDGLMEQKLESLSPFHKWWMECLDQGHISLGEFDGQSVWKREMPKREVRNSFNRFVKENDLRFNRVKDDRAFTRELRKVCPTLALCKTIPDRAPGFRFPELARVRKQFERFVGHGISWGFD